MCCGGYNGYAPPSAFAQRRHEEIKKQLAENKTAEAKRESVSSNDSESTKSLPEKAPMQPRRSRFGGRLLSKIRNSMWSQIDLRTLECSCLWWVNSLNSYSGLANKNDFISKTLNTRRGFAFNICQLHAFIFDCFLYRLHFELQSDLWIYLHISNNIIIQ